MRLINKCTVTLLATSTEHHITNHTETVQFCGAGAHFTPPTNTQLWIYKTHVSKLDRLQKQQKIYRKHINKPVSQQGWRQNVQNIHLKYLTQTVLRATGCSATSPGPWAGDQNVGWSRHTGRETSSHTRVHPVQNLSSNSNNFHTVKTLAK